MKLKGISIIETLNVVLVAIMWSTVLLMLFNAEGSNIILRVVAGTAVSALCLYTGIEIVKVFIDETSGEDDE